MLQIMGSQRAGCDLATEHHHHIEFWGFPAGSDGKESACNVGDLGSIPGSRRSPGEGNGNPLQILAWEIPRTEEPGRQSTGSQSRTRLSDFTFFFIM